MHNYSESGISKFTIFIYACAFLVLCILAAFVVTCPIDAAAATPDCSTLCPTSTPCHTSTCTPCDDIWLCTPDPITICKAPTNPTPTPRTPCVVQMTRTAEALAPRRCTVKLWDEVGKRWIPCEEWFAGISTPTRTPTATPTRTLAPTNTPTATPAATDQNLAAAWDVTIEPYRPAPGECYWKVYRTWHFGDYTPEPGEPGWMGQPNDMRHTLFIDAWGLDGSRVMGAQALIQRGAFSETMTIDKPLGEPGANTPIWRFEVLSVQMLGPRSDVVSGLTTNAKPHWPPPKPGDSDWGLHSYGVIFLLTCEAEGTPTPTATETSTKTPTATASATPTPTATASATPTLTATETPTEAPTALATPTPTSSPSPTPTPVVSPTPTETSTPTPERPDLQDPEVWEDHLDMLYDKLDDLFATMVVEDKREFFWLIWEVVDEMQWLLENTD